MVLFFRRHSTYSNYRSFKQVLNKLIGCITGSLCWHEFCIRIKELSLVISIATIPLFLVLGLAMSFVIWLPEWQFWAAGYLKRFPAYIVSPHWFYFTMVYHWGLHCIEKKLVQLNFTVTEIAVIVFWDSCSGHYSVFSLSCFIIRSLVFLVVDVSHSSCILLTFGFL